LSLALKITTEGPLLMSDDASNRKALSPFCLSRDHVTWKRPWLEDLRDLGAM